MKTCPACNRVYDDVIRFCLEDGVTLARVDQSPNPTMTMPAQAPFLPPPPPPTLQMQVEPSVSTLGTLPRIFFSPGRVFDSFRELQTFSPAAIRFVIGAAIIVLALVGYNALYMARIGTEQIGRAGMAISPQAARLPPEQRERALQMQQTPAFQAFTLFTRFGTIIAVSIASFFLGALIYWLGSLLLKSKMNYMQALLVWTYSGFPPVVLWLIANTLVLLIFPPTTNMAITTGMNGVIHANLGALFTVTSLPVPVYVVALSALDLFEFYGLGLAIFGLRKVARIPWLGAIGIVLFVWLLGLFWRLTTAGLIGAIFK
jgi:hypothetical protein